MDLAHEDPYASAPTSPSGAPTGAQPKKIYPNVTLRGPAAEKLCSGCKVGDELTAEVTFRVVRTSMEEPGSDPYRKGGAQVALEITDMEADGLQDDPQEQDETAEGAVDSYRAAKAAPPEED